MAQKETKPKTTTQIIATGLAVNAIILGGATVLSVPLNRYLDRQQPQQQQTKQR